MSLTQRIEAWLEANIWRFFKAVFSSNRDYPYHDETAYDNTEGQDPLVGMYQVGSNNVDANGDQSKRFVSKRAILVGFPDPAEIRLNDSRNVALNHWLPYMFDPTTPTSRWMMELHTNINAIYFSIPAGSALLMYFEGVLPQEARDAE